MTARRLARWAGVVASTLAIVALLGLLAYASLATLITRADWSYRLFVLDVATLVLATALLLVFLRGRPLRELSRSSRRLLAMSLILICGLIGFAAFGIDSTRPARELPEAELAFPGAIETSRGASPSSGGMFGRTPASFDRSYTTSATYGEVVDYFHRELPARGWSGHYDFGISSSEEQIHNWTKDGFTFQLDIPRDNLDASGPFVTRIWGRDR